MSDQNIVGRAADFSRATVEELKRISTPTKQQTIQATMVTLGFVFLLALLVAIMDLAFGQIMKAVIMP